MPRNFDGFSNHIAESLVTDLRALTHVKYLGCLQCFVNTPRGNLALSFQKSAIIVYSTKLNLKNTRPSEFTCTTYQIQQKELLSSVFRLTLRLTVCIEKVNRLDPLTWIWKGRLEELRTLHSLSAFRLEVPLVEQNGHQNFQKSYTQSPVSGQMVSL